MGMDKQEPSCLLGEFNWLHLEVNLEVSKGSVKEEGGKRKWEYYARSELG
jgi:hypothetical protein